jgi:hypothetical protein
MNCGINTNGNFEYYQEESSDYKKVDEITLISTRSIFYCKAPVGDGRCSNQINPGFSYCKEHTKYIKRYLDYKEECKKLDNLNCNSLNDVTIDKLPEAIRLLEENISTIIKCENMRQSFTQECLVQECHDKGHQLYLDVIKAKRSEAESHLTEAKSRLANWKAHCLSSRTFDKYVLNELSISTDESGNNDLDSNCSLSESDTDSNCSLSDSHSSHCSDLEEMEIDNSYESEKMNKGEKRKNKNNEDPDLDELVKNAREELMSIKAALLLGMIKNSSFDKYNYTEKERILVVIYNFARYSNRYRLFNRLVNSMNEQSSEELIVTTLMKEELSYIQKVYSSFRCVNINSVRRRFNMISQEEYMNLLEKSEKGDMANRFKLIKAIDDCLPMPKPHFLTCINEIDCIRLTIVSDLDKSNGIANLYRNLSNHVYLKNYLFKYFTEDELEHILNHIKA